MTDPLAVSFEKAAENHLRDALRMTHAQRWQWLAAAMALGESVARVRARNGLRAFDPHGERIDLSGAEQRNPHGRWSRRRGLPMACVHVAIWPHLAPVSHGTSYAAQ